MQTTQVSKLFGTETEVQAEAQANTSSSALFRALCELSLSNDLTFEEAMALDSTIKITKQGKECLGWIKQYNDGLITFAEFRACFISSAL